VKLVLKRYHTKRLAAFATGAALVVFLLSFFAAGTDNGTDYVDFPLIFTGSGVSLLPYHYENLEGGNTYFTSTPDLSPDDLLVSVPDGKVIDRVELFALQTTMPGSAIEQSQLISAIQGDSSLYKLMNGNIVHFQNGVYGQAINIYGTSQSNPGHVIWRDSPGTTWQTQGANTDKYYVHNDGNDGCVGARETGVSECPGPFPTSIPDDLEFNGMAVTEATRVEQPQEYYFSENNAEGGAGDVVNPVSADLSSPFIVKEKTIPFTRGVEILDAGHGDPGFGMIKVAKSLTGAFLNEGNDDTRPDIDYMDITEESETPVSGHTQGRNYYMTVNAFWKAMTYQYAGKVRVYYKAAQKPDLRVLELTNVTPITIGSPVSFYLSFDNGGGDVNSPFSIRVSGDSSDSTEETLYSEDYEGFAAGAPPKERTFTYTFNKPTTVTFTLKIDAFETITEDNEANNVLTKTFAVSLQKPTGDFDIVPMEINYRDGFQLMPRNFNIGAGCSYQYHIFEKVTGQYWKSDAQMNPTQPYKVTYPNGPYQAGIASGNNNFRLKVYSSCGESDWVTHKINVVSTENHPPFFKAGWFTGNDINGTEPISSVVIGSAVNLRVIRDLLSTPPSPSDPDGDPIAWHWDFAGSASSWVRSLPIKYGLNPASEFFTNLTADVPGSHTVSVTGEDSEGGTLSRSMTLNVTAPNPIPWIRCPNEVKADHPLSEGAINADLSYSPVPGRTIDHSKDVWVNKSDAYANDTGEDISITVTLQKNYDNTGLASTDISSCQIVVHPDLPPVAKIFVPPTTYRGTRISIVNQSYSQDQDSITSISYQYKFDRQNNGFWDDDWNDLSGDGEGASFVPTEVGQYLFNARVTDKIGKTADTSGADPSSVRLNVLNHAPEVSFTLEGENPQPVISPTLNYSASQILSDWPLYEMNSNTLINDKSKFWRVDGDRLQGVSSLSQGGQQQQYPYPGGRGARNFQDSLFLASDDVNDNGFGSNRLSPYRATLNPTVDTPLIDPEDPTNFLSYQWISVYGEKDYIGPKIRSDKTHLFFNYQSRSNNVNKIYAYNIDSIGPVDKSYSLSTHKWVYQYSDGTNPVDYVIDQSKSKKRYLGPEPYSRWYSPTPINYELAGDTLYVIRNTLYLEEVEEGEDDMYEYYNDVNDIAIFDVTTGQELKSTFDTGAYVPKDVDTDYTYSKGDHLIIVAGGVLYEYDKDLRLVASSGLPGVSLRNPVSSCTGGAYFEHSPFFRDAEGNFYYYEYARCVFGLTMGNTYSWQGAIYPNNTSIVRINADLSFAWRTYIPYSSAVFGGMPMMPVMPYTYIGDYEAPLLQVNSIQGTLRARSFDANPSGIGFSTKVNSTLIRLTDGAILTTSQDVTSANPEYYGMYGTQYHIDWGGSTAPTRGTVTKEGYNTSFTLSSRTGCPRSENIQDASGNGITSFIANAFHPQSQNFGCLSFGEYFQDGVYVYGFGFVDTPMYIGVAKGEPSTEPAKFGDTDLGQFISPVEMTGDGSYQFTLRLSNAEGRGRFAGFSVKMRNAENRLAVETDGEAIRLSRYDDGITTVLDEKTYTMASGADYNFQLMVRGNQIAIYVNSTALISVSVSDFPGNRFGPFSERADVSFSGILTQSDVPPQTDWVTHYAIWENGRAKVRYTSITYHDAEGDRQLNGQFSWHISQTPKFINNQGDSWLNGQTVGHAITEFDKVGEYTLKLTERDDPAPSHLFPDMAFDGYRQTSSPYTQTVTVHRRPVAQFSLSTNADGTIQWSESGWDPDRYDPLTGACSASEMGHDYCANRGIFERKYTYITPSGQIVEGKLIRPSEAGTYTVFEQVKDEYGAWSYPVQRVVTLSGGVPQNNPPTVVLVSPRGDQWSPTLEYGTQPTVGWNQFDGDGDVFKVFEVVVADGNGGQIYDSGEMLQWTTQNNNIYWQLPVQLERGVKYQVRVKVSDGEDWSAWSNLGWMTINSPPSVEILSPAGVTQETPTLIVDNLRPVIEWKQTDPEANHWNKYYIEILNSSEEMVYNTGWEARQDTDATNYSYQLPIDLPVLKPLQARMKITDDDNSLWSDWSNTVWFVLDRKPIAELTWPTGNEDTPTPSGALPTIQWTQRDPDIGNAFTKYEVQFLDKLGALVQDSGAMLQKEWVSPSSQGYSLNTSLPAGKKLRVQVRVHDGFVWSDWSNPKWLLTNRPPLADFDWSPKPVFEGDTLELINRSSDPDANQLASTWNVTGPGGFRLSASETDTRISGDKIAQGTYSITLTMSDGVSEPVSVTKEVEVLPLGVMGWIKHFPDWDKNRQAWNHVVPDEQRSEAVFFAGEGFVLKASTTDTGTATRATRVTVNVDGEAYPPPNRWRPGALDLGLVKMNTRGTQWEGELYDPDRSETSTMLLEDLRDGTLNFTFTAIYSNGVVKKTVVPVNIRLKWTDYWLLHRKQ
jgi:hypothetical protein